MDDNQYNNFLKQIEIWNHNEEFEKIIEVLTGIPDNYRSYELNMLLSEAYISLDRYDEAIELLESIEPICEDNDENANYFFCLGIAYYYNENYEEALSSFEKAHELNVTDIDTLLFLCFCTSEYNCDELFAEYSKELEKADKCLYDSYFNTQNTVSETYTDEETALLELFVENNFGDYNNVLRDVSTSDIICDILLVPPNEEHDFYTLVTCGMGAHKMTLPEELQENVPDRIELVICLPKNWHIKSTNEKWFWPLRLMKQLAHLPIIENSWLGLGHTITNGCSYFENTQLSGSILAESPLLNDDFLELPNGEKVYFYQIIPLYEEEMNYKIDNGSEALFDLFWEINPVLDINRKNMCYTGSKKYKIPKSTMRNLIDCEDLPSGCFATDKIIVDGEKIGFMYRETPLNVQDSGWRFMSGNENDDYMNDTSKSGIYHLNTLCNYDESIIELLDFPVGSIFKRNADGKFIKITDWNNLKGNLNG